MDLMKLLRRALPASLLAAFGALYLPAQAPIEAMRDKTVHVAVTVYVEGADSTTIGKTGHVSGSGSGFVIDGGRHVITNNHVCNAGAPEGWAVTSISRTIRLSLDDDGDVPAQVVTSNPAKDLCVLTVERPLARPEATIALESTVQDGQTVYVMGFPGAANTDSDSEIVVKTTKGIISAKVNGIPGEIEARLYQTDAPINSGNSGGPLFDECGRVIGVNTMKYTSQAVEGVGWAIRADEVVDLLGTVKIDVDTSTSACSMGGSSWTLYGMQFLSIGIALGAILLAGTKKGRSLFTKTVSNVTRRQRDHGAAPAPAISGKPVLKGLAGYYSGTTAELGRDGWSIGRDPRVANLVLPPETTSVSKRHCMIRFDPGAGVFVLEDAWSTNGTFLEGGERVEPGRPKKLKPGSRFYLGDPENLFEVGLES